VFETVARETETGRGQAQERRILRHGCRVPNARARRDTYALTKNSAAGSFSTDTDHALRGHYYCGTSAVMPKHVSKQSGNYRPDPVYRDVVSVRLIAAAIVAAGRVSLTIVISRTRLCRSLSQRRKYIDVFADIVFTTRTFRPTISYTFQGRSNIDIVSTRRYSSIKYLCVCTVVRTYYHKRLHKNY